MSRLFGNDSAKGAAVTDLSCEIAMQAGRAAAAVLSEDGRRSKLIIGKDGRVSSDVLEAAVCAGICSAGADAVGIGTVPSPAAAWLTSELEADACIMIASTGAEGVSSGIRIFSPEGRRFSRETEEQIERLVFGIGAESVLARPRTEMGRMLRNDDAADRYTAHIKDIISTDLSGIKAVLCCLDSCAGITAERLFTELGADIIMLPEPENEFDSDIETASTKLERLMEEVVEQGADCGIIFDGEGFGCIAVDENGGLVDGDSLLAVFAKYYKEQGRLKNDSVVVNYMSGMGLMNFLRDNGITPLTSGAGDRYVLDRMVEEECSLGGEKSGHIIFLEDSSVGDGQLTAAKLMEIMKSTGKKLSELAGEMQKLPQIVLNVRISPMKKEVWKNDSVITDLVKSAEEKLGSDGRVIVREAFVPEPFIRVIIEGPDFGVINAMAMEIARTIKGRCT